MGRSSIILIGTRGSALALAQAEQVRSKMRLFFPQQELKLEVIQTTGDRVSKDFGLISNPDDSIQGLFTKELDEALLTGRIQAAVHSLKDVPTVLVSGLKYGAFLKREDYRDVLISKNSLRFAQLISGSRIGTSSPRREAQLKLARPDLEIKHLRGNLDTRLRKLHSGEYEAVVVAGAGVKRLGRESEITEWLDPDVSLPAPAQGVLCVVLREEDRDMEKALEPLNDRNSRVTSIAERSFLRTLQGGCRVPVGALARVDERELLLSGMIVDPTSRRMIKIERVGTIENPSELGEALAKDFLIQGAMDILKNYGRS